MGIGGKSWPHSWSRCLQTDHFRLLLILICILLCICLVTILIAWGLLSNGFQHGIRPIEICQTEDCVLTAAQIMQSLDTTVNPCDDFYQFACGNYETHKVLSADKIRMSPLLEMDFQLSTRLKLLLESQSSPEEPDYERLAKLLYRSCNNLDTLVQLNWEPLKQMIDTLGGWPLVEGDRWNEHKYEKWEISNALIASTTGVDSIFGLNIDVDMKDTRQRMLALDEGPLGLGNRDYYLVPGHENVLEAYRSAMIVIAMQFGANRDRAAEEMTEVLKLEVLLANISSKPEDRRDHSHLFNPMTVGQLVSRFPEVDFRLWFRVLSGVAWNLTDDEVINVIDVQFFEKLPWVLKQTTKKTIINYELWLVVASFIPFLEPELRYPLKTLQKVLTGATAEPARWEECVSITMSFMGWPLSSLYVKKYFPPAAKIEMESLVSNLRSAMNDSIRRAAWMDNSTKTHALIKLDQMNQKIAYPDYIHNVTRITRFMRGTSLDESAFFDNVLRLTRNRIEREINKLRKRIDRNDWGLPPAVVNAFYSPDSNEIMFPAGILQYPVFPLNVPRYIHYSRIGMVIGHEITHGYDDQGRQFDERGNLVLWWTNNTLSEFSKRAACFVRQYGSIREPVTGQKLNGKLTLGENIADNGAIRLAHKAYQLSVSQHRAPAGHEMLLPGLTNYTVDQLFYISYATNWCEVIRPEAVNMFMLTDSHSLTRYRVNVPLQNYPPFSDAFQCSVGSFMNPRRRCTMW